jgi:hypothetical protein
MEDICKSDALEGRGIEFIQRAYFKVEPDPTGQYDYLVCSTAHDVAEHLENMEDDQKYTIEIIRMSKTEFEELGA